MNALRISAIVLIVAGFLGLAYGSFSYTKQTHDVKNRADRDVRAGQTDGKRPGLGGGWRDRDWRRTAAARRKKALAELLHHAPAFGVYEHTVAVAVLACGDVIVRALLTGADDLTSARPAGPGRSGKGGRTRTVL